MISTCQNCGTSHDLCEQDNKKKFNFCGNWSLSDTQKNNTIKLREVLEFALNTIDVSEDVLAETEDWENEAVGWILELQKRAREALVAPPRNCDVGTADEQAQRFETFCHRYSQAMGICDDDCPFRQHPNASYCQSIWMQMPYKPKEEDNGQEE